MPPLSEEQLARIAESKANALAIRAEKQRRTELAAKMELASNRRTTTAATLHFTTKVAPAGFLPLPQPLSAPVPLLLEPASKREKEKDWVGNVGVSVTKQELATTEMISQSAAITKYLLPQSSLTLLNFVLKQNPTNAGNRHPMKLYDESEVIAKAMMQWGSIAAIEEERGVREKRKLEKTKKEIMGEGKKARSGRLSK